MPDNQTSLGLALSQLVQFYLNFVCGVTAIRPTEFHLVLGLWTLEAWVEVLDDVS